MNSINPIKIDLRTMKVQYSMSDPHNHAFYELHFMLEGTRNIFSHNKMFVAPPKSFFIVPPFVLHQTSGGAYVRINVLLYKSVLTQAEIDFLDTYSKMEALYFETGYEALCFNLLKKAAELENAESAESKNYKVSLIKTLLFYMQNQKLYSAENNAIITNTRPSHPLAIKIIKYLNAHYTQNITLDMLQKEFFLSKTSLCANFKKSMNCTLIDYLTRLRITKAMDFLLYSNKSVEEISEICGFSSSNYFRLIFKKQIGISPLQYRKQSISSH